MYQCPNCGGALKFDIISQKIKCDYCSGKFDPYDISKEKDAEESKDSYDVTIFTCPQCGGEVLSTDESITGFCSFCGASTVLDSRMTKEKKPSQIIPFQQTKDDCKEKYRRFIRGAIFAPKELKDARHIDQFRGIYMPYWLYSFSQKGNISVEGKKEYRRGDYIYTDHYTLSCNVDADYRGISFDASSSFDDTISQSIAPFHIKGVRAFTPSYLSGFYADTSDVNKGMYQLDAGNIAANATYEKMAQIPEFRKNHIQPYPSAAKAVQRTNTSCYNTDSALFPVWFLSYQKNNRVAYATVNGQTGKVVADLPISKPKFVLGSLLLAIPIMLMLNALFTYTPSKALIFSAILALATIVIYKLELDKVVKREKEIFGIRQPDKKKKKSKKQKAAFSTIVSTIIIGVSVASFMVSLWFLLIPVAFVVPLYFFIKSFSLQKEAPLPGSVPKSIGCVFALVIALVILIINPVSDLYFYGGVIATYIGIGYSLFSLINIFNVLATRKLPQFEHQGGDDRA